MFIACARPNFMKIAPSMHALKNHSTIEPVIVYTGQHYDGNISDLFSNSSISPNRILIWKFDLFPMLYKLRVLWKDLRKCVLVFRQRWA